MKEKQTLQPGTMLQNGRCRILDVLGQGGFGITYQCEDLTTGETVAVKELFCLDYMKRAEAPATDVYIPNAEDRKRYEKDKAYFLHEYKVLARFRNEPGVVRVRELFEENNTAYIVMDYLEGISLRTYVDRQERMAPEEIFARVKPVMQTLGRIHKAGLIHRDLSPDNIMVLKDGSLCLIDFGASLEIGSSAAEMSEQVGKNGYAPNEFYLNPQSVSPASDIYSFFAAVYYSLTGQDPEDSLQRLLLDELQMPSALGVDIDKRWEYILSRALCSEQQDRWQSFDEILSYMDEIEQDKREEQQRNKRKSRMKKLAWAAGILIAAVIVLLLVLQHIRREYHNDYSLAYEMQLNEATDGKLRATLDPDYYLYKAKESGELMIRFGHKYEDAENGAVSGWKAVVYEEEDNEKLPVMEENIFLNDNEKKELHAAHTEEGKSYYIVISGIDKEIADTAYSVYLYYAPQSVKLDQETLDLVINDEHQLTAKVEPSFAASGLNWSSSDPAVATVSADGKVSALRYGEAVITASSKEDRTVKARCRVQTRFYDVNDPGKGYYKAVYWAVEQGVAGGYDWAFFGPDQGCIQRDVALFLWRLKGKPKPTLELQIDDVDYDTDADSYKAMEWAVEAGIFDLEPDGTLKAEKKIIRAEAMRALYRLAGSPETSGETGFSDMENYAPDSEIYRAVHWCETEAIAGGFGDGTIRPDQICSRGDMILMIYKYAKKNK